MTSDRDMRAVSERIEALVAELETVHDQTIRSRVEDLVRLVMQLHAEGLARMLAVLREPEGDAGRAIERFSADPVVASVLMLHDLHPHDVQTRVGRALDDVRSRLGAQVDLTLLAASDEIIRVRIDVAPGACGAPVERIRDAVDAAIRDAAPDVRDSAVELVAHASTPPALIQVTRR